MSKQQSAGSKLFISNGSATAATQTEFEALTWCEVGELLAPGEFGKEYTDVAPTPAIGDRRQDHFKGSYDNGTLEFEVYFDPNDAGQQQLKAALDSDEEWGFKITLHRRGNMTPTTFYSRGPVMSIRTVVSDVNSMVTARVRIGLNQDVVEVAAAAA